MKHKIAVNLTNTPTYSWLSDIEIHEQVVYIECGYLVPANSLVFYGQIMLQLAMTRFELSTSLVLKASVVPLRHSRHHHISQVKKHIYLPMKWRVCFAKQIISNDGFYTIKKIPPKGLLLLLVDQSSDLNLQNAVFNHQCEQIKIRQTLDKQKQNIIQFSQLNMKKKMA